MEATRKKLGAPADNLVATTKNGGSLEKGKARAPFGKGMDVGRQMVRLSVLPDNRHNLQGIL